MERRTGRDRRVSRLPAPRYWFGGRRRSSGRRLGDRPGYIDIYPPDLLFLVLTIMILSLFDGFFTLLHLQNGGMEANPLMRELLEGGPSMFLAVKILATGLGVLILCLHSLRRGVRVVLNFVLAGYLWLLGYHCYLFGLQ